MPDFFWQDWVFVVGQILFFIALIPSIISPQKPPLSSCLLTTVVLVAFAPANWTLDLYLATGMTVLTASAWGVLSMQQYVSWWRAKYKRLRLEEQAWREGNVLSQAIADYKPPASVEFCCVCKHAFELYSLIRVPRFRDVADGQGGYTEEIEALLYCSEDRPPYDFTHDRVLEISHYSRPVSKTSSTRELQYFKKQLDRTRVNADGTPFVQYVSGSRAVKADWEF